MSSKSAIRGWLLLSCPPRGENMQQKKHDNKLAKLGKLHGKGFLPAIIFLVGILAQLDGTYFSTL